MKTMKAVIFCHFHHRAAEYRHQQALQEQQLEAEEQREIVDSVVPYYKAYLKCRNVGLVYVYVDTGVRQILDHMLSGKINIDINELAFEHTVRNILKLAVDEARRQLAGDKDFDAAATPKFQFIGLPHLATLIASLYRRDKNLVRNLAGGGSNFTYDAPKFVEAVIRLARGQAAWLSEDPILRFDQDVRVNEESIDVLLSKINNARMQGYAYSLFSGGYGSPEMEDPVNDYAVRCHWLADAQAKNEPPFQLVPNGLHFLRDIGEFGATSIPNSRNMQPSGAMLGYIQDQGCGSTNRESKQVISGAGLYMSLSAILRLPPFMNFQNNIVWVDDHLKRRLHEVIGDLATGDLESVPGSLFHQDRYPKGIRPRDIEWAKETYFYRLISGCILHALIVDRAGKAGELGKFVDRFMRTRRRTQGFEPISKSFMAVAKSTTLHLLDIWAEADYGNNILKEWAEQNREEFDRGNGMLTKWITSTVQDAVNYCKLVQNWTDYVTAIQALVPRDAYWLFRSLD